MALPLTHIYTHDMSKNKRLQIPINADDESLFKSAAKIYKVPAAEWARRVLRKAALRDISGEVVIDPLQAVALISSLNAPVGSVDEMKEESRSGRCK